MKSYKRKWKLNKKNIPIFSLITIFSFFIAFEYSLFSYAYSKGENSYEGYDYSAKENIWFQNQREIVSIKSKDGLTLYANKFINKNSNKWVILVHGFRSNGKRMARFGLPMYEKGYNVLILELRGNGVSDGEYYTYGVEDRQDIKQWINYIIDENEKSEIVLFGTSMGGAAVMLLSNEELPKNVTHIIEDSGYSNLQDEFKFYMENKFNLPAFPSLNICNLLTKIKFGYYCEDISPKDAVANSKLPILFIHGTADQTVPFEMLDIVYTSANCPKEKIVVENATHIKSMETLGNEYWEKVFNFIEKY